MKEAWTLEVILAINLKITIKERTQFDNKKPEEYEPEFDNFDVDDSYSTWPVKGRNIVDLDPVSNNYLMGVKLAKPH